VESPAVTERWHSEWWQSVIAGPRWLACPAVRALDSQLYGHEFDSWPPCLVLGWVTIFWRANHLIISQSHPGQLSLLLSLGREVSTSHSVVMLCDWGVKAGMAHSVDVKNVQIIKHYTNKVSF